jgi:hypothetical protein
MADFDVKTLKRRVGGIHARLELGEVWGPSMPDGTELREQAIAASSGGCCCAGRWSVVGGAVWAATCASATGRQRWLLRGRIVDFGKKRQNNTIVVPTPEAGFWPYPEFLHNLICENTFFIL